MRNVHQRAQFCPLTSWCCIVHHNASWRIWPFAFVDSIPTSYMAGAAAAAALRFSCYHHLLCGLDNLCLCSLSVVTFLQMSIILWGILYILQIIWVYNFTLYYNNYYIIIIKWVILVLMLSHLHPWNMAHGNYSDLLHTSREILKRMVESASRNPCAQSGYDPMPTILSLICGVEPSLAVPLSMAPGRKREHLSFQF